MSADALAPDYARPSAGSFVLIPKLDIFPSNFLLLSVVSSNVCNATYFFKWPTKPCNILGHFQSLYSSTIWISNHLTLLATQHFIEQFVQADNKETWKLSMLALCGGNPLGTSGFPSKRTSYRKSISISWCHHVNCSLQILLPGSDFIFWKGQRNHAIFWLFQEFKDITRILWQCITSTLLKTYCMIHYWFFRHFCDVRIIADN